MTRWSRDDAAQHVVYVVTSAVTAQVLLRGQLGHLRSRGVRVSVVTAPDEGLERLAREEDVHIAPVVMSREVSLLHDLAALVRMVRVLRRLRPDVVNVSTPKAALLAGLAALLLGVPHRVYTVRGLRLEGARGLRWCLLWLTERITVATATRVWFVSPSARQRAVDLGLVRAGRGEVLGAGSSNGVDVERFRPRPATTAAVWPGLPQDAPVVGFVGRLTRDKGVPELWEAVQIVRRLLPRTALLLVGDVEDGDPLPADLVHALQADPLCRITGWTGDPTTAYPAMDVLALPSHREGLPNVVLEASACGLPVVTTCATGAVDAVVPGVTGLVVPVRDPQALAAALLGLLQRPALRAAMGRAGRERVVRDFRREQVWQHVAREYDAMRVPARSWRRNPAVGVSTSRTPARLQQPIAVTGRLTADVPEGQEATT